MYPAVDLEAQEKIKKKGDKIMAYKTPEQMVNLIIEENLLTDACMTIIDGRNEYGFHAVEIPPDSIRPIGRNRANVLLNDSGKNISVPVTLPDTDKEYSLWLMSFIEGKYEVICVQHDPSSESKTEMKKKEYLSVIAFFLDHYKIGTRTKLLGVLKNGYAMLKKEIGDNNAYDLLRDYMNESLVVQRAEEMPDKYGVRFKFHLND